MQTIGGFSIVRRLGSGSRAHVHLGRSEMDGVQRTAAIKVFHETVDTASIGAEIEALSRTSSPHLLRVDDLALDEHGRPALILPRLGATSLATLLVQRGALLPGETVTILAPIASAVAALHRAGVAHGGIRCSRVLFDDSGAPVLTGFGRAVAHSGGSDGVRRGSSFTSEVRAAIADDLVDLSALARTVLESTEPTESTLALIRWSSTAARADAIASSEFAKRLHDRLFDLAVAQPVDFATRPGEVAPIPARVLAHDDVHRGRRALRAPARDATRTMSAWSATFLPEWVTAMAQERRGVTGGLESVRRFLAPVRARVWWTAGIVGTLLVVALVLVPPPSGRGAGAVETSDAEPTSAQETSPSSGEESPPAPTTGPDEIGEPAAQTPHDAAFAVAVLGEDEVAAATALLTARNGCLDDRSAECLDRVDQQDSAALDLDRRLLSEMREAEPDAAALIDLTTSMPVLVERLGASALLELSPSQPDSTTPDLAPISVLIVKGADGWRIRDIIVGGSVP